MSAYLMVSLNTQVFLSLQSSEQAQKEIYIPKVKTCIHRQWNHQNGWKTVLNNLRLVIQPTLLLGLISPWLEVFPNSSLGLGFHDLINAINQFQPFYSSG